MKSFDQVLREGGYTGEEAEAVENKIRDNVKVEERSLFLGTHLSVTLPHPMFDGSMLVFEGMCSDGEAIALARAWERAEQELRDMAIKYDGDSLNGLYELVQITRPFAKGLGQRVGYFPPEDGLLTPVNPT